MPSDDVGLRRPHYTNVRCSRRRLRVPEQNDGYLPATSRSWRWLAPGRSTSAARGRAVPAGERRAGGSRRTPARRPSSTSAGSSTTTVRTVRRGRHPLVDELREIRPVVRWLPRSIRLVSRPCATSKRGLTTVTVSQRTATRSRHARRAGGRLENGGLTASTARIVSPRTGAATGGQRDGDRPDLDGFRASRFSIANYCERRFADANNRTKHYDTPRDHTHRWQILLMKRFNVNAVRTSHPNDPLLDLRPLLAVRRQ